MRLRRSLVLGTLIIVAGCVHWNQPAKTASSTSPELTSQLQSFAIGDWCRVVTTDARAGRETEHIGQVQRVTDESVTLTRVTTQRQNSHPGSEGISGFTRRSGSETDLSFPNGPVTVPLSRIHSIERMSHQQAVEARWKPLGIAAETSEEILEETGGDETAGFETLSSEPE